MSLEKNNRTKKLIARAFLIIMLLDICLPNVAHALTSGPSQPEVQSFEPMGTTDMVDLLSGDFTYNIPLMELPGPDGGYPFNLAYHAGIAMEQEATWVGLGWNINVGVINRNMRGVPDDFKGDHITHTTDMKPNYTIGIGAAFSPDLEVFGKEVKIFSISAGVTPYYNSYRGFGYSISLSPSVNFGVGDNTTMGLGASLSSDSQNGTTYSPTISLSSKKAESNGDVRTNTFSFSLSYNARQGVSNIGLGYSSSYTKAYESKNTKTDNEQQNKQARIDNKKAKAENTTSGGVGMSINLNNNFSYSPTIQNEMKGSNLNVGAKFGVGTSGAFADVNVFGFYNVQNIKYKNQPIATEAYGNYHLESIKGISNTSNTNFMMDFNREGDGLIQPTTPLLPIPNATDDIFSISGQGVAGNFRLNRSSVGFFRDKSMSYFIAGGSIGVDIGPGAGPHWGINGSVNFSNNANDLSPNTSKLNQRFSFENKITAKNPYYQHTYFATHGDISLQDPDKLEAYLNGLDRPSYFAVKNAEDPNYDEFRNNTKSYALPQAVMEDRKPRSNYVQAIENQYLPHGRSEMKSLSEFKHNLYEQPNQNNQKILQVRKPHHIGAFSILDMSGKRYIYGLPAYNLIQEEHSFSVPKENNVFANRISTSMAGNNYDNIYKNNGIKQKSVTEVDPFAHSYMLTAVLGNDYIDLTGDGPSDDDLGYWVKFNYEKKEDYKWRSPYSGANYLPGQLSDEDDDKGYFMYGERENWFMTSAETKSHIITFELSPREDAKGWDINPSNRASMYKLDSMRLYTKHEYKKPNSNPIPIKTVHFGYETDAVNQLCSVIPNTSQTNGGKLTLKEVYFTFRDNTRGAHNKYKFEYNENPGYSDENYSDCWGNYNQNLTHNVSAAPYVPILANPNNDPTDNDVSAAAWNLSQITTPSGAIIEVEYETDDYAYVQNKRAMNMFRFASNSQTNSSEYILDNNQSYVDIDISSISDFVTQSNCHQLLDNTGQLYFKANIKNMTGGNSFAYQEFVTGYLDIDTKQGNNGIEYVSNEKVRIHVKPFKEFKGKEFHPITHAALEYFQASLPNLMSVMGNIGTPKTEDEDKEKKRAGFLTLIEPIFQMFKFRHDFYANASRKGAANKLIVDYSFVRLNDITGFKEGGGHRVKRVYIKENPSATDLYGQVYDYTTYDTELGKTISSGVATYEPGIGGEQNALKKGIVVDKQTPKMRTNLRMFMEYPFNESYFPSPSVGYSKVTIKSINTSEQEKKDPQNQPIAPVTGTIVHEFYTCKDFPILIKESKMEKKESKLPIFGPLGPIHTTNRLSMSQGFFVELNDMHGKPKSVSYYAHDKKGKMMENPYSEVQYVFKTERTTANGAPALKVKSEVDALLPDGSTKTMLLGVDYDLYMDVRKTESYSNTGAGNFNVDMLGVTPFIFPLFTFIPTINSDKNIVNLTATNKIVWRKGILEQTIVRDENSIITTKNLNYDVVTGAPLLTRIENNYNDYVYNYTIPAYWKYGGMGPAYLNLDLKFQAKMVKQANNSYKVYDLSHTQGKAPLWKKNLFPGDEFLVYENGNDKNYKKAYLMSIASDHVTIDFDNNPYPVADGNYHFYLTRSGRRNQLAVETGTVTARKNPLIHAKTTCP